MFRFATTALAPQLAQHLPARAQVRLLSHSYLRMQQSAAENERVLTTSAGDQFRVDLGSFQEWQLWVYGSLENQMARLFHYLVRPGDRCVDIGAGIGLHTIRLAKLAGPTGEVIAIESNPEMAWRATRNIALNGLANARVIPTAASDPTTAADPAMAPTHVPAISIDEACLGWVALINVNAEERATAVLAGATATIARDRPGIVFEYVPDLIADHDQCLFGHLAESGYLLYRIQNRRNRLTGHSALRLDPLYAWPKTDDRLLAVSEDSASRIISLVAFRDGRT